MWDTRPPLRAALLAAALALTELPADRAGAGAWTLPAGTLWTKVTYFQQDTDEWYTSTAEPLLLPDNTLGQHDAGTRRPYRFNGNYNSKAVFVEAVYGLTDRVEVGLQVPWFDQVFDDDTRAEPPADAGIGDLRVHTKVRLLTAPLVVAVKGAVKLPTGKFRNEDGLVPVGEGQWDYDASLQVSRSLWPVPVWVHGELGYRVRTKNDGIDLDPGDEWLLNAEFGYRFHRRAWTALKLESLRGRPGRSFGFQSPSLIRRITYVAPSVSVDLGAGVAAEAALRFTVSGRNYPAGYQLLLGLSTQFNLPLPGRG